MDPTNGFFKWRYAPGAEDKSVLTPAPLATPGQRLMALRKAAGHTTAAAFARSAETHVALYQRHESDRLVVSRQAAEALAVLLGTSPQYILYGEIGSLVTQVAVTGLVGLDGRVLPRREDTKEMVDAPTGATASTMAIRVVNGDLFPSHHRNDLLYFDETGLSLKLNPAIIDGRECVIDTKHEGIWLAWITISAATGRATLIRHNGRSMMDVPAVAASPILWVKRA